MSLTRRALGRLARQPAWSVGMWRILSALMILRPRAALLIGEARGGARRYRVGSETLVLRHRSRDIDIVNEIWGAEPAYEPPSALVPRLARPGLRILDLGANIGLFALFAFSRWRVGRLVSWEPDAGNARLLARVRQLNPQLESRWELRPWAIANFCGEMAFLALGSPESHRPEPGAVAELVGVDDLFSFPEPVDLLKIDIEGGEWALLGDERLAGLAAEVIVVEWHWRGCPDPEPHDAAVSRLERAGYRVEADIPGHVPGIGVLWAARPA